MTERELGAYQEGYRAVIRGHLSAALWGLLAGFVFCIIAFGPLTWGLWE